MSSVLADSHVAAPTPGPWHWHFMGTAGRWTLLGEGEVQVQLGGPPDQTLSPDQVLTAAAPEMLAALRGLLASAIAHKAFSYLDKGIGTATPEGRMWLAARDAVRKATEPVS